MAATEPRDPLPDGPPLRTAFDSRPDTHEHIAHVRGLLNEVIRDLLHRAHVHDQSKLEDPERSVFDVVTPRLRTLTYGSAEYRASLREMRPALAHHYGANAHHPEHHERGIHGMSLVDLLEMLCDWLAAAARHDDGDIRRSIEVNRERFGYGDEIADLLLNTLPLLEGPRPC